MLRPQRMRDVPGCNGVSGTVVWSPVKSLWFTSMALTAVIAGPLTWSFEASAVSCALTVVTLCAGHSVGMHRLLIHRSFDCPKVLERCLVCLGTLVGMGGPRKMTYLHEIRDWCQRQPECHPFFIHQNGLLLDAVYNLHCECRLRNPPSFEPEPEITEDRVYQWLDRFWMAVQLPLAGLLYAAGGMPFVVWGICVRVATSLTGHWFVGWLAHNFGEVTWPLKNASVQGCNVPGLGLITMGESWHNNHHAFPESARMGLKWTQPDPGWWLVCLMRKLGLVRRLTLPKDHPVPEVMDAWINQRGKAQRTQLIASVDGRG